MYSTRIRKQDNLPPFELSPIAKIYIFKAKKITPVELKGL